ncbi:MAG: TraB/GumN family protein [Alphaproteobacteria bacterium]|nr:TraB/GumN family protein [Alphaproteobacteria bacterium]
MDKNSLSDRIRLHEAPLTDRDFIITDSLDQAAIDAVLHESICETRAGMEPGARLYVVMGEEHRMPTHIMAQAGLLDNLATDTASGKINHGSLLLAHETPYDILQFYATRHYGLSIDEKTGRTLHEKDPLGHHFARAFLVEKKALYSPCTLARVFNACLQHNIPLAPIDTACDDEEEHINPADALAGRVAQELYGALDLARDNIPTSGSPDKRGIVIRNAVMVQRMIEAANLHKADTIVAAIGFGHMGGDRGENLPYETSITGFLNAQLRDGDKILPVYFSLKDEEYDPGSYFSPAFWAENPQAVIIRGASEGRYSLNSWQGLEDKFIKNLGKSYREAASGPIPARFSPPPQLDKKAIREDIEHLITQTFPHMPSF